MPGTMKITKDIYNHEMVDKFLFLWSLLISQGKRDNKATNEKKVFRKY